MKIFKIQNFTYDHKNVTYDEFRSYINYLAKNNINKTFKEPDRFITEAERTEKRNFEKFLDNLASNSINKTFIA